MVPEITQRTVAIGIVAVVVIIAALAAVLVAAYDQPRVDSIESEFGEVDDDEAEVHTTVVVDNPNDQALPGGIDLGYTVALNDVEVATGQQRGVRIQPGQNTIETTARFDNSKIPAWWVTHVNNGERTAMTTRARVGFAGLPVGPRLPGERQEITTDLLGPLGEDEESTVKLGDSDVLVVGQQDAEWREADAETTPLEFSTELENVHDRPVRLDGTVYEMRMNGVVVGEGETDDGIELDPGESRTFHVAAAIDTPKMQEWWVAHLRNGESTDLQIEVFAVADDDGERKRLPLSVFERQATFETDLLGSGETSVTAAEEETTPGFTEPRVEETTSEWGEVRDDETAIRTTADVVNDNDEEFSDLLTLDIQQQTTLAGLTVASGTEHVDQLPQGEGQIEVTTTKDHSVVPEWWAAHLNNGEVSETRTETTGEADVAVTTLPLDLEDRQSTIETGLLADLNDDSTQREGPLRIHSTEAVWDDPTPEEGPIVVTADIENTSPLSSVTIRDVDYVVDINGIELADARAPEEHTLTPGERREVQFTIVLDNSKMEDWWPTHVRNDEGSEIGRDVTATIETDGEEERRDLEFLSETVEVETDLLGPGDE